MSLPDKNAPWPELVNYFKNNKKDGENLGIILKRASAYRKTGKVMSTGKMPARGTAKKQGKKSKTPKGRFMMGGNKDRTERTERTERTDRKDRK